MEFAIKRAGRWATAASGIGLAIGLGSGAVWAQSAGDGAYQTFFGNTVCNNPPAGSAFRARCLETFDASQPAGEQFANISTNSESSLRPNQAVVTATNSLASTRALADLTEAKLESLRSEESGKPTGDSGKIAGFGAWSVFANFTGEWFDQSRSAYANERGFDGNQFGGTLGVDYRLGSGGRIGVIAGYSKYKLTFDAEQGGVGFVPAADAGGVKAKTFSATLFGTFPLSDHAWADLSAGMAWSDNDFRRNAVFQPNTRASSLQVRATGSADGRQWFASAGTGYDFTDGGLTFGPYLRATYAQTKIEAYSESEAAVSGLAMRVDQQKAKSLAGVVGAKASYSIGTTWGVIVPQARFEYQHEFEDDARLTVTRFVLDPNNTPLPLVTDAPDRNHFNLGLGLSLVLPGGVMPYLDYEALVGYSGYSLHRVTAGLRIEF